MKRNVLLFCLLISLSFLVGCQPSPGGDTLPPPSIPPCNDVVNATKYGLSTENDGARNSIALQSLIDVLSEQGGTIYIPSGEYAFAANGTQTLGSHCIKMRSNVNIVGDGDTTVLKPIGDSWYGLDMFYFNDYLDTDNPIYLRNCRFESFVIDAIGTSSKYYTSAGKGFMFNLFENCHWRNVTVKNTDATGFGVDCPIDSTISECTAIACGKAATEENTGASGFGIGFGYSEHESLTITNCKANDNKKFGFFFEHQGRFNNEKYHAVPTEFFRIKNCEAVGNLFGFGGVCTTNTVYEKCSSMESLRCGFMFKNSRNSGAVDCTSENEGEASFAILQTADNGAPEVKDISYLRCLGKRARIGLQIISENSSVLMGNNRAENCIFEQTEHPVYTQGVMQSLILSGNSANTGKNCFLAETDDFQNIGNSWNQNAANHDKNEN